MSEHEIEVTYRSICDVCGGDIYLDDDDLWVHDTPPEPAGATLAAETVPPAPEDTPGQGNPLGKACEPLGGCVGAYFLEWQRRAEAAEAQVERLTRECLDRENTETDARERLRQIEAGADSSPRDEAAVLTPGQAWHELLTMPAVHRLLRLERLLRHSDQYLTLESRIDYLTERLAYYERKPQP